MPDNPWNIVIMPTGDGSEMLSNHPGLSVEEACEMLATVLTDLRRELGATTPLVIAAAPKQQDDDATMNLEYAIEEIQTPAGERARWAARLAALTAPSSWDCGHHVTDHYCDDEGEIWCMGAGPEDRCRCHGCLVFMPGDVKAELS